MTVFCSPCDAGHRGESYAMMAVVVVGVVSPEEDV